MKFAHVSKPLHKPLKNLSKTEKCNLNAIPTPQKRIKTLKNIILLSFRYHSNVIEKELCFVLLIAFRSSLRTILQSPIYIHYRHFR